MLALCTPQSGRPSVPRRRSLRYPASWSATSACPPRPARESSKQHSATPRTHRLRVCCPGLPRCVWRLVAHAARATICSRAKRRPIIKVDAKSGGSASPPRSRAMACAIAVARDPAMHCDHHHRPTQRMAVPSAVAATLDAWSRCDRLDTLFVLFCTSACWLVVPAIGLAYSGYSIRGNGLASYFPALLVMLVVTLQWWAIGYSIAFSPTGNGIVGDLSLAFHRGVGAEPMGTIPGVLFSMFQMVFCATVCAMAVGGAAERGRIVALVPFIFLWATFVYCPLAHMVWSENGMLAKLGVMDFAGGTPVHICSGSSATAISVYLSRPLFRSKASAKRTPSHLRLHKPYNISNMLLAMVFIWSCWLPFESGTALALNFKAVMAFCVTQMAAAAGSLTWCTLSYFESGGKWSLDSATLGMLAGLVMITPAGGFVGLRDAAILGVLGSLAIFGMLKFKSTQRAVDWKWVDPADVFATHAFGGVVATMLCGVFGESKYAGYDGATEILGGVLHDGHYAQLAIQLAEGTIGAVWSFSASFIIIALIDCVPGLEVLSTDEELLRGMDNAQMLESLVGAHAEDEADYEPIARPLRLD